MAAKPVAGPRYVRVVDDPVAMAPVIRILREMRKARLAEAAQAAGADGDLHEEGAVR